MFDGLEEGDPPCFAQSRMLDVFGKIGLQRVVTRHFVELAALLVEPYPQPPLLVEDIADVQSAGGGDAGEGEDHHADQGTIAQPDHFVRLNRAQQVAGLPYAA
jgi:hypothetical protein